MMAAAQRGFAGFHTMSKREAFYARDLEITLKKDPTPKPGADHTYTFGGVTTDHMLEVDYDMRNGGW